MDWDALRRAEERGKARKAREQRGTLVPGTGRRVTRPGRNARPQDWAKWRAGAWGTVPRWEWPAGPKWAVDGWLTRRAGTVAAAKAAQHVEMVWGGTWLSLARQMQVDPLVFGEWVSKHAMACSICQSEPGLELWEMVLPRIGVNDILRILMKGREDEVSRDNP